MLKITLGNNAYSSARAQPQQKTPTDFKFNNTELDTKVEEQIPTDTNPLLIYGNEPNYDLASEICREQVYTLLNKFYAWGQHNEIFDFDEESFMKFADDFNQKKLGHGSSLLTNKDYQEIKRMLERIFVLLEQNQNLPLPYRIMQFKNLVSQFQVCGSGLYISINAIQRKLNIQMSVDGWLEAMRATIVSELIANQLHQEAYHGYGQDMQPHYVNACCRYGVEKDILPIKYLADISDENQVSLTTQEKLRFDELFDENYTPTHIVNNLVTELSHFVYSCLETFVKDPKTIKTIQNFDMILEQAFSLIHVLKPPFTRCRSICENDEYIQPEQFNRDATQSQVVSLPQIAEVAGEYEEFAAYVRLIAKNEFQRFVVPYIIRCLATHDYIAPIPTAEKLSSGDIFYTCGYLREFSWIETTEDQVFSYSDYFQNNPNQISLQIQTKLASNDLQKLLSELRLLHNNYQEEIKRVGDDGLRQLLTQVARYNNTYKLGRWFINFSKSIYRNWGWISQTIAGKAAEVIVVMLMTLLVSPLVILLASASLLFDTVTFLLGYCCCTLIKALNIWDDFMSMVNHETILDVILNICASICGLIAGLLVSPFLTIWLVICNTTERNNLFKYRIAPLETAIATLENINWDDEHPINEKMQALTQLHQIMTDHPMTYQFIGLHRRQWFPTLALRPDLDATINQLFTDITEAVESIYRHQISVSTSTADLPSFQTHFAPTNPQESTVQLIATSKLAVLSPTPNSKSSDSDDVSTLSKNGRPIR